LSKKGLKELKKRGSILIEKSDELGTKNFKKVRVRLQRHHKEVELKLVDQCKFFALTSGSQYYQTLSYLHFKDSQMIVLLYSVTNSKSLEECYNIVETIREKGDPSIPICLVGTK